MKATQNQPGNGSIKADSLFYQGEMYTSSDNTAKALIYYKAAERIARTVSQHDTVINCLLKQVKLYLQMRNYQKAINKSREGLAYSRLLSRSDDELNFFHLQVQSLRLSNKLDEAIEITFQGMELATEIKNTDFESNFIAELAEISLLKNEVKKALSQATSILRRAILFNDSTKIPVLSSLVDRIYSAIEAKELKSKVSVALKNLPPLQAQYSAS